MEGSRGGPAQNKEVNNPIITVPLTNLTVPITVPISSETPLATPPPPSVTVTPTATTSPAENWCVASQSTSDVKLQVALDYACGHGADCSAIQPNGGCYIPNTVRDHASYAFNNFYRKNPAPSTCYFAATAVITSTNPSSGSCIYPSTSITTSILNTTNESGATVFGAERPMGSSSSWAAVPGSRLQCLFQSTFLVLLLQGWSRQPSLH